MQKKVILIVIILINIFALENPSFAYKPARASARQKACFSNQRVIEGAIEMYDMDHDKFMETALPGGDFERLENILLKEKYLKSHIEGTEEKCSYGFIRYNEKNYDVFCKNHGTIETKDMDHPVIPTYNVNDEKPFSEELTRKIEARRREREFNKTMSLIFSSPIPYIILFFVVLFILPGKKKKNV